MDARKRNAAVACLTALAFNVVATAGGQSAPTLTVHQAIFGYDGWSDYRTVKPPTLLLSGEESRRDLRSHQPGSDSGLIRLSSIILSSSMPEMMMSGSISRVSTGALSR